ncbi:EAL domain-containing protein [Halobacillus yeomjeoni]|uniref:EAL domain-containing protein n=1 Tax=Halobacillus yeomjeoni TaxID=311194 RepID=A0A931MUY7_9BACI|nr:EAL domain-containing protein [Halobacillus yeomjeoni]MBH0229816.1 EAL domain-containing protein [Halobacillus yeomjeoni]
MIKDNKKLNKEIETRKVQSDILDKIMRNMTELIIIINLNGIIEYASPSFGQFLKINIDSIIQTPLIKFIHFDDRFKFQDVISKSLKDGDEIYEKYRMVNQKNETFWFDYKITPFEEEGEIKVIVSGTDSTSFLNLQKRVEYQESHDTLTGLKNRNVLEESLQQSPLRSHYGKILSYFVLDLDGFKMINDTKGEEFGSEVLRAVAERLKRFAEDFNGEVYRLEADEFLLEALVGNELELQNIAALLLDTFNIPFEISGEWININISIGISSSNKGKGNGLLSEAESALKQSKQNGKNTYTLYIPSMDVGSYKTFTLQNDIHEALQKDDQLFLNFQPKVNGRNGEVLSAEVLLRWNHPYWGTISPGEFFPIIEEKGLSSEVDFWVFDKVLKTLNDWNSKGVDYPLISINISAINLNNDNIAEELLKRIKNYRIPTSKIELELTETALINDKAVSVIKVLRESGLRIAIDDFGTGYSTLSYLKKISFDTLKIDKLFISDLDESLVTKALLRSMITLGEELNIDVIAEGVETLDILNNYLDVGGNQVQGFLFSKPLKEIEFIKVLKKGKLQKNIGFKVERRKEFRLPLNPSITAMMTITNIKGESVTLGQKGVEIKNIGPGGLNFKSDLLFPVKGKYILKFHIELKKKNIVVEGRVVWKKENLIENNYNYGVQFTMDEIEKEKFISTLNHLQVNNKI